MKNRKSKVNKETILVLFTSAIVMLIMFFSFSIILPRAQAQETEVTSNTECSKLDELLARFIGTTCEGLKDGTGTGSVPIPSPDPNATPTVAPFPSVSPPAGNLPPTNSLSAKVKQISDLIVQSCGLAVHQSAMNRGCLNVLRNLVSDSAIYKMYECPSRGGGVWLQCVCHARAFSEITGKAYNGLGNAKTHIGKSVPGYKYYDKNNRDGVKPAPGDLALWDSGSWGHIALITDVRLNYPASGCNYAVHVAEANYNGNGTVRYGRQVICNESGFKGWQKRL